MDAVYYVWEEDTFRLALEELEKRKASGWRLDVLCRVSMAKRVVVDGMTDGGHHYICFNFSDDLLARFPDMAKKLEELHGVIL